MISAEQFAEWKEHPVTKEIFKDLKEVRQDIINQLANGNTIGADAEATHGHTSKAIGQLDGINQLLGIHYAAEARQEEVDGYSGY